MIINMSNLDPKKGDPLLRILDWVFGFMNRHEIGARLNPVSYDGYRVKLGQNVMAEWRNDPPETERVDW